MGPKPVRGANTGQGPMLRAAGRRGAVLVAAIVCLAVASMIFVSIVKMAASCRRVADTQSREVQAGWLAESGLERAAARLDAEEDYSGETWTISATDLAGRDGAVVVVEVLPVDGRPRRRLVRARADYPNDSHHRARQTREVVVPLQ